MRTNEPKSTNQGGWNITSTDAVPHYHKVSKGGRWCYIMRRKSASIKTTQCCLICLLLLSSGSNDRSTVRGKTEKGREEKKLGEKKVIFVQSHWRPELTKAGVLPCTEKEARTEIRKDAPVSCHHISSSSSSSWASSPNEFPY